jgi:regulator of cell morphogenesis and NO signaling
MTVENAQPALRQRTVGDLAATLPGATAVFRRFKIDFCCNGDLTVDAAAHRRGVDLGEVEGALHALVVDSEAASAPASAMGSEALIHHIQTRYHAAHRRALPELIALSRKVEAVHREHPKVPAGLCDALRQMENALEQHLRKEEATLVPAELRTDDRLRTEIGELRREHDEQGTLLRLLESLTDDFTLPAGACRSWQALYVGTAQLAEDLMEHIHLENNVLFPRLVAAESRA